MANYAKIAKVQNGYTVNLYESAGDPDYKTLRDETYIAKDLFEAVKLVQDLWESKSTNG